VRFLIKPQPPSEDVLMCSPVSIIMGWLTNMKKRTQQNNAPVRRCNYVR
jgi:hypothetical protein